MSDAELEAIRERDGEWMDVADSPDLTPIHLDRHEGATHLSRRSCERSAIVDRRVLLARLNAAEARERALREALVGVAPFTLGIDGTPCYCDEDDDSHSDACAAARALLAEPTEGGS